MFPTWVVGLVVCKLAVVVVVVVLEYPLMAGNMCVSINVRVRCHTALVRDSISKFVFTQHIVSLLITQLR